MISAISNKKKTIFWKQCEHFSWHFDFIFNILLSREAAGSPLFCPLFFSLSAKTDQTTITGRDWAESAWCLLDWHSDVQFMVLGPNCGTHNLVHLATSSFSNVSVLNCSDWWKQAMTTRTMRPRNTKVGSLVGSWKSNFYDFYKIW